MSTAEQLITILAMSASVIATRALPFLIFTSKKETPKFVEFLSKYLPGAVFGMLVIYCLKDVDFTSQNHGIIQFIGIAATVILHLIWRNMLVSIAGGTIIYMLILQNI